MPLGISMGTQANPVPAAGVVGWDWGGGEVLSRRDLEAMAGVPERLPEPDFIDRAGHLCACVCCAVAGVLATMGVVTGLVAWVKFSWNYV